MKPHTFGGYEDDDVGPEWEDSEPELCDAPTANQP